MSPTDNLQYILILVLTIYMRVTSYFLFQGLLFQVFTSNSREDLHCVLIPIRTIQIRRGFGCGYGFMQVAYSLQDSASRWVSLRPQWF